MFRLILTFFVAAIAGLFLQGSVLKNSVPSAIAPDLIVVLVATIGLRYRSVPGLFSAFALGLLADFASGLYLGPNAAGAVVAFMMSGVIANRVYADKGVALFLIVFLCSLSKSLVIVAMILLYVGRLQADTQVVWLMLIEAFLSALCAPVLVRLMFGQPSWRRTRDRGTRSSLTWIAADR